MLQCPQPSSILYPSTTVREEGKDKVTIVPHFLFSISGEVSKMPGAVSLCQGRELGMCRGTVGGKKEEPLERNSLCPKCFFPHLKDC